MRIRVLRYYHAGRVEYQAGEVIHIDDPTYAAWLLRDANGGMVEFVPDAPRVAPVSEQARVVESPAQDRMVRTRKRRKV